jgi:hypothetical protein
VKAHEIISLIRTPVELLIEKNINPLSVAYLDMYHEYAGMCSNGLKKTYIISELCEKYKISRTKFLELINRFEKEI